MQLALNHPWPFGLEARRCQGFEAASSDFYRFLLSSSGLGRKNDPVPVSDTEQRLPELT